MTELEHRILAASDETYRAWCTNDGELFGLPPTGRSVTVRGSTFSVFDEDGFVLRDTHDIDDQSLFAQLSGDGGAG